MGIQVGQLVVKGEQSKEEIAQAVSASGIHTEKIVVVNDQYQPEEVKATPAVRRQQGPQTKMSARTKRGGIHNEEPVVVINGVARKFPKQSPYLLDMLTTDE